MKRNFIFLSYCLFFFSMTTLFSCSEDDSADVVPEDPIDEPEAPVEEDPNVNYDDFLVAHFQFEGNLEDASANKLDATLVGEFNEVEGMSGSGIFLNEEDGVNECGKAGGSFVQLPALGEIWQEGFTVTAWVKFTENRYYERIIDIGNGLGEHEGYPITLSRYDTTNHLALTSWTSNNSVTNREKGRLIAEDVIKNGQFQFVAATISPAGEMKLYIDGELVAEKAEGHGIKNVERTQNFIGHSNYCKEDDDFRGVMDELRLYNKNLPAEEIRALYEVNPAQ